jgi:hypothetical protein
LGTQQTQTDATDNTHTNPWILPQSKRPDHPVPAFGLYTSRDVFQANEKKMLFNKSSWIRIKTHIDSEFYQQLQETASVQMLEKHSIHKYTHSDSMRRATKLIVLVTQLRRHSHGQVNTCLLQDPSGDLEAEIHEDVFKQYDQLAEGSAMLLANVCIVDPPTSFAKCAILTASNVILHFSK